MAERYPSALLLAPSRIHVPRDKNLAALRAALEARGIVFSRAVRCFERTPPSAENRLLPNAKGAAGVGNPLQRFRCHERLGAVSGILQFSSHIRDPALFNHGIDNKLNGRLFCHAGGNAEARLLSPGPIIVTTGGLT